jgi:ABC-type branched-subunit amino acid transport system ATPase component
MTVARLTDVVVTRDAFPVLAGLSWTIEQPGAYVVRGGNGSGKTSLLRVLAGLDAIVAGEAEVLGHRLTTSGRRDVRRRAGWLGHDAPFHDALTVAENLAFASTVTRVPRERMADALEQVELGARSDALASRLSAGQRRRLGIAWLIMRRPELWLLDEPHAALDEGGRQLVDDVVARAVAGGATVVLTTHHDVSLSRVDGEFMVRGGR